MRVQDVLRVFAVALPAMWARARTSRSPSRSRSSPRPTTTRSLAHTRRSRASVRARPSSTKTIDASGRDETGTVRARPPNPLTGPFYVEGAEPGDTLVVRFHAGADESQLGIQLVSPRAVFADARIDRRAFIRIATRGRDHRRARQCRAWDLDLTRQTVRLSEPSSAVHQAGISGEADARLRRRRARRRFRADVEPVGLVRRQSRLQRDRRGHDRDAAGLSSRRAAVHRRRPCAARRRRADAAPASKRRWTSSSRSSVRKKANLTGPRVETSEHIISVGSQPEFASSLDRALQMATSDMVNWLTSEYKTGAVGRASAHRLSGRYDVVTVAGSMGLKIPKKQLPPQR